MNRIVREHYPVADLPEDLRDGFDLSAQVRVVVEPVAKTSGSDVLRGPFSLKALYARSRPSFASTEDVSAHINDIRDEWIEPR